MKSLAIVTVVALCALATDAAAQTWQPPLPNERCPSKWGAADERGSGNHMTPSNVLRAAQLIKTGETFELSHVLGRDMPLNPGRQYDVHIKRSTGPFGSNQRYSNEELVISEIGQVGTQFDGFTHQAIDRLLYNCVKMDEIATRSGFTKMGMEKVGTLMTRGVLIDIAGLKGVEILPINYEITVADLEQALQKQGIRLQAGDAVLI
jgi:Putative cyclase